MNHMDMDKLLEQGLSGDSPRQEFREQVLRDSILALVWARRARARWRAASLAAAAVLVAGVSFLLGRYSLREKPRATPRVSRPITAEAQGVTVPNELIQWLEAARLFRQLGMEDRMAHAVDRASQLLPRAIVVPSGESESVFAADGAVEDRKEHPESPGPHSPVGSMNRILAHSLGE